MARGGVSYLGAWNDFLVEFFPSRRGRPRLLLRFVSFCFFLRFLKSKSVPDGRRRVSRFLVGPGRTLSLARPRFYADLLVSSRLWKYETVRGGVLRFRHFCTPSPLHLTSRYVITFQRWFNCSTSIDSFRLFPFTNRGVLFLHC